MFSLTQQEKLCLWYLCGVLFLGYGLHYSFKKYPSLKDMMHFIEKEEVLYKIDVNNASYEELIQIPYIGEFTAKRILKKRERLGRFVSLDEIKNIPGLYPKSIEKFIIFLKVRHE